MNTLRWFSKDDEFPLILGREFCGVVKERGQNVRDDIQIGDKVWGLATPHHPGSHAEYVVVDQNTVCPSIKQTNFKLIFIVNKFIIVDYT